MYEPLNKYKIENIVVKEVEYQDGEALNLSKELMFFHNKNKFRPELTRLQQLFNDYLKYALHAPGIRDTYLDRAYSNEFLIVLMTNMETHKRINDFIENLKTPKINKAEFNLQITSEYILLLAKDMKGLVAGVDTIEEILRETFEDFFRQKKFDDYIKIRPLKLLNCKNKE